MLVGVALRAPSLFCAAADDAATRVRRGRPRYADAPSSILSTPPNRQTRDGDVQQGCLRPGLGRLMFLHPWNNDSGVEQDCRDQQSSGGSGEPRRSELILELEPNQDAKRDHSANSKEQTIAPQQ